MGSQFIDNFQLLTRTYVGSPHKSVSYSSCLSGPQGLAKVRLHIDVFTLMFLQWAGYAHQ